MRNLEDLVRNIKDGRERAHAYILEGRAGSIREKFLSDLIKGLECKEIDIVRMSRSGKSGYKVSDASGFSERLGMSPYGRYLAGIIDDAEQMGEVVQNKLLKTLEEPPEDVLIFLLSSRSDELLRTVRSRCSLIRTCEYEGYEDETEDSRNEELMTGVLMLLNQRAPFHEFREFLDKSIKTREDALLFISCVEERLEKSMTEGRGAELSAGMIEKSEKTAVDIIKGMDKNKALRRLYLELYDRRAFKA